jgi:drug/metabolite transporter (DMT)-like permease
MARITNNRRDKNKKRQFGKKAWGGGARAARAPHKNKHPGRKSNQTKLLANLPFGLSPRWLATILMLVNVIFWGAALPISKFALDDSTAFRFLLYRFSLAAIFSLPILFIYWKKLRPKFFNISKIVVLETLGTSIALGSLYFGLKQTSALEASLLVTTIPVFVTLGGIFFLGEKQNGYEWAGLFLALAGSIFLVFEPLISGNGHYNRGTVVGNSWIMFSNIVTAAYYLLAKKHYQRLPKLFVASVSFWVGMVTFLILAWWELNQGWSGLTSTIVADLLVPSVWWPSLYMAIFGSIIGLTAYIAGQNFIEASEASYFSYLQPMVYIPLSFYLHDELLTWGMGLAIAVIMVGVLIAEIRWSRVKV